MVILSKLVCVHTYNLSNGQISIVPGRNAFDDVVGRELTAYKPFQDSIKYAKPGELTIEIPAAPLKVETVEVQTAGGKGKPGPKAKGSAKAAADENGEILEPTAVSDMTIGEAIKTIRLLTVAPQIEEIYNKDPRAEVKEECQKRLDKLIDEAQAEAAKKQD